MKKWDLKTLKTWQIIITAAILLTIVIIMIVIAGKRKPSDVDTIEEYAYTVKEQELADKVIAYLQETIEGLGEATGEKTANEAVESYRLLSKSDADLITKDHTQAIQSRISKILKEYVGKDAALSETDIPILSAGVAEIVWESILSQQQIKEPGDHETKVSVRKEIKNNTDLTSEKLLSILRGMSDEEIEALLKSLGLSIDIDELRQLLESGGIGDKDKDKELEELLAKLKKELEKELEQEFDQKLEKEIANGVKELDQKLDKKIANGVDGTNGSNGNSAQASNGTNGRSGTNGKDGRDGQDGQDGKDGKDGKAGQNGDSIFIRYSEDSTGKSMTEKPTASSKWMGTYVGANASTNPADYTWTRYSDATISYSDGTLYITQ